MKTTYLLQRLGPPRRHTAKLTAVWGRTALTAEALHLLEPICELESMGAYEYEDGTIGRVLFELAQKPLAQTSLTLMPGDYEPNPSRKRMLPPKEKARPTKTPRAPSLPTVTLYVLCPDAQQNEVLVHLRQTVKQSDYDFKRGANLAFALDPVGDLRPRTRGWIDLDNGYVFGLDKPMMSGFYELLTPAVEAATPTA